MADGAAPTVDRVDFQLLDRPSQRCQELALDWGTGRQTCPSQCESSHPLSHTGRPDSEPRELVFQWLGQTSNRSDIDP